MMNDLNNPIKTLLYKTLKKYKTKLNVSTQKNSRRKSESETVENIWIFLTDRVKSLSESDISILSPGYTKFILWG